MLSIFMLLVNEKIAELFNEKSKGFVKDTDSAVHSLALSVIELTDIPFTYACIFERDTAGDESFCNEIVTVFEFTAVTLTLTLFELFVILNKVVPTGGRVL